MKTKTNIPTTKVIKSALALLTATVISLSAINYQDVLAAYLVNVLDTANPISSLSSGLTGHWTFDGPDVSGSTTSGSATNSGWVNAGTGANVAGVGTVAWSNPGNALTNNSSYATVAGGGAPNWFNTGYGYRKKLTIDKTKVGGASNLTNYPILVSMTDAALKKTASGGKVTNTNGYDIIFTDGANSVQLAHEIESYDSVTGAINMWVRIPSLSTSVDTDFYIYYGNSGISTSQQNAATVWAAYEAVLHLNDVFTDSSNSHDGVNNGTTATTGVVGNGRLCSESPTRFFSLPESGSTLDNATNMTISIWARPTAAFASWDKIMAKGDGTNMGWVVNVATTQGNKPSVNFYNTSGADGGARSSTAMTTNGSNWYHIAAVKTGTDVSVFTNGTEAEEWSSAFSGTPRDVSGDVYICANMEGWGNRFKGDVDEVRIAKTNLSAGWIATEYNTITSKGTGAGKFIKTVASEETSGSGSLTTNYLRASNFGFSIPTNATIDGVEVQFERKKDNGATTTTSTVKLVNAAGAVTGNNNSGGLSWGNTDALETLGGASNLWGLTLTPADVNDTDFGFVVSATHNGTTAQNASVDYMQVKVYYTTAGTTDLTALDVSGNGKNGTVSLSTVTEGHMGQAFDFDGTTNNYINVGNAGTGVKSVAFWMQADDTTTRNILALSSGIYPNLNASSQVVATGFTTPTIYVDGVAGNGIPDTGWHHVVITTNTGINASAMEIGRRSTNGSFDGKLDDVRIYNRVLTANEITRLANMHTTINATSSGRYSQGLVGYWTLDGGSIASSTVLDTSGQNKNGTLVNMTITTAVTPGSLGQALDFNGTNNYINVGNAGTGVKSVAFWMQADTTTGRNILALSSGIYPNLVSSQVVATGFTSPTIYVDGVAGTNIPDTGWHHVVITTNTGINASAMEIGRRSTGYFDGKLDDVRIYNRAITADEAVGLYFMGDSVINSSHTDRISDGIVGHWTFDGQGMSGSTTSGSATNSGWVNAGTGANVAGVGTVAWSNPGNALTNNSSYATVAGGGAPNWFNTGYGYRKKLTIDKTKVGGASNLTNYPILVSMTDAALKKTASGGKVTNTNGYDIIFTDGANSVQLAHEIESYDSVTGAINMWVRIPSLSTSVDTDFYIYYGNSGISTSQQNAATVWAAYEAVWHLNGVLTDSANSHNGTDNNTLAATGVVASGRQTAHGATNRYVIVPDDGATLDNATNMTTSIWVKPNAAFVNWDKILTKGQEGTSDIGWALQVSTTTGGNPSMHFFNTSNQNIGIARSTVAMSTAGSTWYHLAGVKTGNDVSIFTDGIETEGWTQAFAGTPLDTNGSLYIGANTNGWGQRFNGDVDEVRIAKTNLSAGWIATEYNTITSKGTGAGKFIKTVASEETSGSGSLTTNYLRASNFGFNIPVGATINGVEVRFERKNAGTTNTNIVKLVNAAGAVAGNDNSTDPSWTGSDTLETYGGASDLWGLSLSRTDINDTDFGFVVSATHNGTTAQNASVDYMQVKVYYTTAGASNITALDVSGNGNDGDVNTATVTEGNLGQAMSFNGTSDYINVGATGQTIKSVSFWMKADAVATRDIIKLNATPTKINLTNSTMTATAFTTPTIYVDGVAASTIPDTGWHHVAVTTNTGISASALEIGHGNLNYFDGILDDVRVYNVALTATDIADLYKMGN